MNRAQRRQAGKGQHKPIIVQLDARKPLDLGDRLALFISPRQCLTDLRHNGQVEAFNGGSLLGLAQVARRVAITTGLSLSINPIKALIQAVEHGVVNEEQIDAAEVCLDDMERLCKMTPRGAWAEACRHQAEVLDIKELMQ